MGAVSKKEADAYDRMLDAAAELAELIESAEVGLEPRQMEELSVFLAKNSVIVKNILRKCKRIFP